MNEENDGADISGTRERLFEAAERLIAERGLAHVSLREITAEAGVNLASVNYHFGSRDGLILALFKVRVGLLNRERLRLLRAAEQECDGVVPIERILRALIAPPILGISSGIGLSPVAAQFLWRVERDPNQAIRDLIDTETGHLQPFVVALARALPRLAHEEICWRLHFTLGAMHYAIGDVRRLRALIGNPGLVEDAGQIIDRLVAFASAGVRDGQTALPK